MTSLELRQALKIAVKCLDRWNRFFQRNNQVREGKQRKKQLLSREFNAMKQ